MRALAALCRIEWLKAVKRRAFWVTLGAFAVAAATQTIAAVSTAQRNPNVSYALPESWPDILGVGATIGALFVGVLMILLVAPEFSWRTGRQNVIDGLSKERFYAGKVLALGGLILLFTATTIVIGASGTLFSPGEGGPGIMRAPDLSYLGGLVLCLLIVGSAGLMLSALIRASGPALGVLILYIMIEELVEFVMSASAFLEDVAAYLPANILADLGENLAHYPEVLARVNLERAERGLGTYEFLDVGVLATSALIYSAIFLGIAFLSLRKRDM